MDELKIYYFNADGLWFVGISRGNQPGAFDGVGFTDPVHDKARAQQIATEIGETLQLSVEELEVGLANTPWSQSDPRPN